MNIRRFLTIAACCSLFTGCSGGNSQESGARSTSSDRPAISDENSRSNVPERELDPVAELRAIMERGKLKIPADKRGTLASAELDVLKSSSLVVPYVGQILSEWDDGSSGNRGRIVVYYKFENQQWTPVWANRGLSGGVFPGGLREGKALMKEDGFSPRDIPNEFVYPWSPTATYRIKAWDPSAQ